MRPNVVLIVFDTARADAFEPYGAGDGASPTVAQLARRGTACPMAIAPANWTMPSHASMFAGGPARSIGLGGAPGGRAERCRPVMESLRDRLLPEVLRRAGYATAGASCNAWISRHTGFDTGFDHWVDLATKREAKLRGERARDRIAWAIESVRARVDDGAREAEQQLREWLAIRDRRPFFWFVNLVECHSPYLPPRPYNDLSPSQRFRAGEEARRHLTFAELWRACLGGYDIPAETMGRMRHLYGRSIRQMDDWLGRVLTHLDEAGILDETLVIVTSDHGENLGEERLIGHSFSLDQRLIRVPLVVAGGDGLTADGLVSMTSLPLLIADAIGLREHPWGPGVVPMGVAISQYKPGGTRDDPRVQKTITDWGLGADEVRRLCDPATSATDGRWKVVRHGDVSNAYDLEADPFERGPIPLSRPQVLNPAAVRAVERLQAVIDAAETEASGESSSLPSDVDEPRTEEIAELEDRLRELGYM